MLAMMMVVMPYCRLNGHSDDCDCDDDGDGDSDCRLALMVMLVSCSR